MQRDDSPSSLLLRNVHSYLIIIGLLLLLAGQVVDGEILKLRLGDLVANLGALLLVTGSLQWLFDAYVRKELFHEVARATLKNLNVAKSGINDVVANAKSIDYADLIKYGGNLVLARNWSTRVLKQNIDAFRSRVRAGKQTTLIVLDAGSDSAKLVQQITGTALLQSGITEFENIASELKLLAKDSGAFRLLRCRRMLHYSFVCTEECIWLTPYRSSQGLAEMPAIEIIKNSLLYDHFRRDIDALMVECSQS